MAEAQPKPNISIEAALQEAEARFTSDNPRSQARDEAAGASMPGGNTRSVLYYSPFPLTLVKGEGARVEDLDGHGYADFLGEFSAGLYGHSNPVIQQAVREALDSGIVLGAPNGYEAELAALLCDRFPSCDLVRFCNSGTESNLMALGAARAFTGRDRVLVFRGGYHGGVLYFRDGPASPVNAPFEIVEAEYNDTEGALAAIEANAGQLAAILIEPMMGGGGGIPAEPQFLEALRGAATRHGIVLIFDEVMTSRFAPGGLQSRLELIPDLTTFGKYLGGGLSFGAFGGRADIMSGFDPRRPDAWGHAGTFNNNVLTMAAGLAGLSQLYTPEAAAGLDAAGDRLRDRLNALGAERGLPVQVLGIGSILCVHFQSQPIRRPADTKATPEPLRALFHLDMLSRGYYLARRGYMSLSLALTEDDYDGFCAAFDGFLDDHARLIAD